MDLDNDALLTDEEKRALEEDENANPAPFAPAQPDTPPSEIEPAADDATVQQRIGEDELKAWQGRVAQAQQSEQRANQLAVLNAERGDNLLRENAEIKKRVEEAERRAQAAAEALEQANKPKLKLPEQFTQVFDEKTAQELEAWVSSQIPADTVRKADLEKFVSSQLASRDAEAQHRTQAANKQLFADKLRDAVPDLFKAPEAFYEWASKHPGQPMALIKSAIDGADTTQIDGVKYWFEQFQGASGKPQGLSSLANASKGSTPMSDAPVNTANWEREHERLLADGKFKEAEALLARVEKHLK